ncbi:MAG: 2-phospho-L-lactate guanylyltransferase [Chloroflexota bacterium]
MRGLWAIVPVKPLREGKSRLASVLTDPQRWQLNRSLLSRTLKVLRSMDVFEQILVISRDNEALSLARREGARTILENGSPELNASILRATAFALKFNVQALLILPTDLPLLDTEVVMAFLHRLHEPPAAVIAPDRHHQGTNALLLSPPGKMEYCFGERSFEKHLYQVKLNNFHLEVMEDARLALDLDTVEDFVLYERMACGALAAASLFTEG